MISNGEWDFLSVNRLHICNHWILYSGWEQYKPLHVCQVMLYDYSENQQVQESKLVPYSKKPCPWKIQVISHAVWQREIMRPKARRNLFISDRVGYNLYLTWAWFPTFILQMLFYPQLPLLLPPPCKTEYRWMNTLGMEADMAEMCNI